MSQSVAERYAVERAGLEIDDKAAYLRLFFGGVPGDDSAELAAPTVNEKPVARITLAGDGAITFSAAVAEAFVAIGMSGSSVTGSVYVVSPISGYSQLGSIPVPALTVYPGAQSSQYISSFFAEALTAAVSVANGNALQAISATSAVIPTPSDTCGMGVIRYSNLPVMGRVGETDVFTSEGNFKLSAPTGAYSPMLESVPTSAITGFTNGILNPLSNLPLSNYSEYAAPSSASYFTGTTTGDPNNVSASCSFNFSGTMPLNTTIGGLNFNQVSVTTLGLFDTLLLPSADATSNALCNTALTAYTGWVRINASYQITTNTPGGSAQQYGVLTLYQAYASTNGSPIVTSVPFTFGGFSNPSGNYPVTMGADLFIYVTAPIIRATIQHFGNGTTNAVAGPATFALTFTRLGGVSVPTSLVDLRGISANTTISVVTSAIVDAVLQPAVRSIMNTTVSRINPGAYALATRIVKRGLAHGLPVSLFSAPSGDHDEAVKHVYKLIPQLAAHAHPENLADGFWSDLWDGIKSGVSAVGNWVSNNVPLATEVLSNIPITGAFGRVAKAANAAIPVLASVFKPSTSNASHASTSRPANQELKPLAKRRHRGMINFAASGFEKRVQKPFVELLSRRRFDLRSGSFSHMKQINFAASTRDSNDGHGLSALDLTFDNFTDAFEALMGEKSGLEWVNIYRPFDGAKVVLTATASGHVLSVPGWTFSVTDIHPYITGVYAYRRAVVDHPVDYLVPWNQAGGGRKRNYAETTATNMFPTVSPDGTALAWSVSTMPYARRSRVENMYVTTGNSRFVTNSNQADVIDYIGFLLDLAKAMFVRFGRSVPDSFNTGLVINFTNLLNDDPIDSLGGESFGFALWRCLLGLTDTTNFYTGGFMRHEDGGEQKIGLLDISDDVLAAKARVASKAKLFFLTAGLRRSSDWVSVPVDILAPSGHDVISAAGWTSSPAVEIKNTAAASGVVPWNMASGSLVRASDMAAVRVFPMLDSSESADRIVRTIIGQIPRHSPALERSLAVNFRQARERTAETAATAKPLPQRVGSEDVSIELEVSFADVEGFSGPGEMIMTPGILRAFQNRIADLLAPSVEKRMKNRRSGIYATLEEKFLDVVFPCCFANSRQVPSNFLFRQGRPVTTCVMISMSMATLAFFAADFASQRQSLRDYDQRDERRRLHKDEVAAKQSGRLLNKVDSDIHKVKKKMSKHPERAPELEVKREALNASAQAMRKDLRKIKAHVAVDRRKVRAKSQAATFEGRGSRRTRAPSTSTSRSMRDTSPPPMRRARSDRSSSVPATRRSNVTF